MTDADREALAAAIGADTDEWVIDAILANRDEVLRALGCRDNMSKADRSHLAVDKALRVIADFIERERGGNDE